MKLIYSIASFVLFLGLLSLFGCQTANIVLTETGAKTITYEEIVRLNNCGGKADTEQVASQSFSSSIEGGGEFKAGFELAVTGRLSSKYGQNRTTSKSIKLVAPPETNMEFTLKWTEEEYAGNVRINGKQGQYTVRVPISVEQISARDIFCDPDGKAQTEENCWRNVWTFSPDSQESIFSSLTSPRSGYSATYDSSEKGSLRLETSKVVPYPLQDPNAWSWMNNVQTIEAKDGLYRLDVRMKTQNAVQSHITIIGFDASNKEVRKNGSNQIALVPSNPDDGTFDWSSHTSGEFKPKEWSSDVQALMLGINAGWSSDGQVSITWFDEIKLQFCDR